jgi:hypothetical protein
VPRDGDTPADCGFSASLLLDYLRHVTIQTADDQRDRSSGRSGRASWQRRTLYGGFVDGWNVRQCGNALGCRDRDRAKLAALTIRIIAATLPKSSVVRPAIVSVSAGPVLSQGYMVHPDVRNLLEKLSCQCTILPLHCWRN